MKLKFQIDGDKVNSENDFHDVISKELTLLIIMAATGMIFGIVFQDMLRLMC